MIPSTRTERHAALAKTRAETMKMRAETRKLLRESYFVPIAVFTGLGCAMLAGMTALGVAIIRHLH